ncbi:MAG: hypothetical protein IKH50_01185, partial [Oscillospiraceae bacterium]|nr:hypothetical protein [Oscillospiraceae bacterium]
TLRAESVSGQLDGTIPSTSDGQSADSSALIDTGDLNISDMGTMNMGGGKGGFGGFGGRNSNSDENSDENSENSEKSGRPSKDDWNSGNFSKSEKPSPDGNSDNSSKSDKASDDVTSASKLSFTASSGLNAVSLSNLTGVNAIPLANENNSKSQGFGGNMPADFDPENMPEGFEPGNMPGGNGNSDSSRPDMGNFPSMGGSMSAANGPTTYILLGVSALVLVIGLAVALKFKR